MARSKSLPAENCPRAAPRKAAEGATKETIAASKPRAPASGAIATLDNFIPGVSCSGGLYPEPRGNLSPSRSLRLPGRERKEGRKKKEEGKGNSSLLCWRCGDALLSSPLPRPLRAQKLKPGARGFCDRGCTLTPSELLCSAAKGGAVKRSLGARPSPPFLSASAAGMRDSFRQGAHHSPLERTRQRLLPPALGKTLQLSLSQAASAGTGSVKIQAPVSCPPWLCFDAYVLGKRR